MGTAFGQDKDQRQIIQLTGVVFASDSLSTVPGVHVYAPTTGRGTTTNPYGFFTMPVQPGDSLVFSSIGFKKFSYIVPSHDDDTSLKILVSLQEDVALLDEVQVFPYPTEAMFKQAILAMDAPDFSGMLSRGELNNAYLNLPASAADNYRYYQQLQQRAYHHRYQMPENNLLNPWAWARAIKSLKKE